MSRSHNSRGGRRRPTRDPWDWEQAGSDYPAADTGDRFQEGSYSRSSSVLVEQANKTAVVKWFNVQKGFGFATPEDGSPDVFLHASALGGLDSNGIPDGATIICDIGQGARGPQVLAVHSVDLSTTSVLSTSRTPDGEFLHPTGASIEGTVKWFKPEKGFGFITPDGGGKDLFVHIRAIERAGLATLEPGDRVSASVKMGRKGPEADHLIVI